MTPWPNCPTHSLQEAGTAPPVAGPASAPPPPREAGRGQGPEEAPGAAAGAPVLESARQAGSAAGPSPLPTVPPRLVTDLYAIPLAAGRFLIYAPLVRAAFQTSGHGVRLLRTLQAGSFPTAGGEAVRRFLALLRELEILEPGRVIEPVGEKTGPFAPTTATLFLTTACNLRCTYCYAAAGDAPADTMSWDVAVAAMSFIQRNALATGAKDVGLFFHGGGEPTVAWPLLQRCVAFMEDFARPRGIELRVAVATNGVLRDEQIDYLLAHASSLSISCDGMPTVQDALRPTAGGGGSSERVLHTLRRLDAARLDYGIRVTVTDRVLPVMVESIAWLAERFKPRLLHVEPAFRMGRCDTPGETVPEVERFLEEFRRCREAVRPSGVSLQYSGATLGHPTGHFCGVTNDNFAVTSEGIVTSCYEAFRAGDPRGGDFFYGRLNRATCEWELDPDRIARLRAAHVRAKPWCQDCFLKWHCAGDCHHRTGEGLGSQGFHGTPRCHLNRELSKDLLLEYIRAGGGAWKETCQPA